MSEKLLVTCENYLKTREADRLGLETIKDVVEYYIRKGMQK